MLMMKMWSRCVVLCLLSALLLQSVGGFNLETANHVRHNGPSSSMFGFTVATYKERGNSWVLVGAPEAQNDYQPTVRRGGAVYRCTIGEDDNCQMVPFDRKGSNLDTQGREIDNKSGQWFGATLNSAGENGPVVACAPRYVYFTNKRDRREPVGTCYVSRGEFQSFSEYSPCRTALHGYHRHGSCQAGFSAAISNDGERLFSGNPGAWYWQGQVNSIDAQASFPYTPGKFGGAFGSGQVVQQSLSTRPAVLSTKEGIEKDDNSYMGYSIAVGDFTGDGEQGVAAGMPRGAGLLGKVVLFTWNLTNHQNITGTQLGSYFGYSIAVCDVDGDRTDDLIIGAPLHTEPNNEGKYEVGRVYVIYQGEDRKQRFRKFKTLDGINSKSRFGLSVASLGDINLDGYGDFVVGAPYDGPHERGAVYIYHGSKDGVNPKHSQVIFSEDVADPGSAPMSTFGFSVAGGIDLDHNDYPDMAVGAYLSNSAYFFRSRPVVKVNAFVQFLASNKQIILDEKNCTLINGHRVPCTNIDICFNYTGLGVPHNINLDVQYVLDAKKTKDTRMFFIDSENKFTMNDTLQLQRDNRPICRQKMVYIKNDIKDKLTPLEAEIRYSMKESRHFQQSFQRRDPKSVLLPILDLNVPPVRKDSISIHKNCGRDNVCIPDLRLIANSSVEKYLLKSNEKLQFDIIVQNEGEDSFESTFDLSMPAGVDFNKIIQYDKNEVRFLCSPMENNTIRCDIGNPLPAGKIARFTIQVTPNHKEGMSSIYEFSMAVNSTNPEDPLTVSDNQKKIHIPIWVNSKLELGGTSRPSDIHYNASQYASSEEIKKESDIGPQVIHVYSIKNNGPSDITEAEMLFLLPYATLGGEDLLYLLEQPHTLGNVKCEAVDANYRDYELDYRKKTIWETIGIDTAKADFASAAGQIGGIIIEEGEGTRGAVGGSEKVHMTKETVDSGDGSLIHQQRRKQQQTGGSSSSSSGSGTLVHVGEDGSRVRVETHSSSWNSSGSAGGPTTVTHVYSKNTTRYIGPDGKVHYHESSSGDKHGGAVTSSASSGGGSFVSGSEGSFSGGSKPQIIYTSTGKQHGNQQGNSFITMTSSSSASDSGANQDHSMTGPEGRRSGQTFNHEEGGKTIYQSGEYPGNKPQTVNKHFNWNRGSQTNYNQQQGGGSTSYESGSNSRAEGGRVDGSYASRNEGGHGSRVEGSYTSRTEGGSTHGSRTEGGVYSQGGSRVEGGGVYSQGGSRVEGGGVYSQGGSRVEGSYTSRTEGGHAQGGSRVQGSHASRTEGGGGSRVEGSYNSWSEGGAGGSRNEGGHSGGGSRFESSYNQSRTYGTATTESGYHHQQQQGGHGTYQSRYNTDNDDIPYSSEEYIGESYENTYDEEEARRAAALARNRTHHQQWSSSQGGQQQHHEGGGLDLGAAALGSGGFRTTTFDVSGGMVGGGGGSSGGNVQMSNQGAASGSSQGGNKWESRSETHWSSSGTGDVPPQYHASASLIERDNVATDKPDYNNRFHGRRRRQVTDDDDIRNAVQCKSTKCMMVRCVVGPLLNEQDAIIALRSRINVRALKNISTSQPISFSSMMLARISKLQYIGRPAERQIHSHEIFTTVPVTEPDKPKIVPLWVVVLSAVAGTIILLLLIFLLYKFGFFKRNRHSDAPERQPLNRNGFYQNGDAAL